MRKIGDRKEKTMGKKGMVAGFVFVAILMLFAPKSGITIPIHP